MRGRSILPLFDSGDDDGPVQNIHELAHTHAAMNTFPTGADCTLHYLFCNASEG